MQKGIKAVYLQTGKQAVLTFSILWLLFACGGDKKEIIDAVEDRAKTPRVLADSITTVISDSGITRYRISAPVWEIYDRDAEPYWEFPQGINFERFDSALNVDANIHSNYAKYLTNSQIWELCYQVRAINAEGCVFLTEQMFWNQRAEKIYSDSLITIIEPDSSIFIGNNGFESNQQLTKYTVKNNRDYLWVEE